MSSVVVPMSAKVGPPKLGLLRPTLDPPAGWRVLQVGPLPCCLGYLAARAAGAATAMPLSRYLAAQSAVGAPHTAIAGAFVPRAHLAERRLASAAGRPRAHMGRAPGTWRKHSSAASLATQRQKILDLRIVSFKRPRLVFTCNQHPVDFDGWPTWANFEATGDTSTKLAVCSTNF